MKIMTPLILRLTDGTTLIAKVKETPNVGYFCTNVLEITMTNENDPNKVFISLHPFMVYTVPDAGFHIPFNMAAAALPNDELLDNYNKFFSPIILP